MAKGRASDGWDAMEDWADSEMLILGDDGEMALYVPMTEPGVTQDTFGNEKARVLCVRVGDEDEVSADKWQVQERLMGKNEFREYKGIRDNVVPRGDFEGKVVLRLVRDGKRDSTKTRYHVAHERDLKAGETKSCDTLLSAFERK